MYNDLKITDEEYKQIKAIEDEEDSIIVNNKNLGKVRILNSLIIYFL